MKNSEWGRAEGGFPEYHNAMKNSEWGRAEGGFPEYYNE
jgi:hypothetical protein